MGVLTLLRPCLPARRTAKLRSLRNASTKLFQSSESDTRLMLDGQNPLDAASPRPGDQLRSREGEQVHKEYNKPWEQEFWYKLTLNRGENEGTTVPTNPRRVSGRNLISTHPIAVQIDVALWLRPGKVLACQVEIDTQIFAEVAPTLGWSRLETPWGAPNLSVQLRNALWAASLGVLRAPVYGLLGLFIPDSVRSHPGCGYWISRLLDLTGQYALWHIADQPLSRLGQKDFTA